MERISGGGTEVSVKIACDAGENSLFLERRLCGRCEKRRSISREENGREEEEEK